MSKLFSSGCVMPTYLVRVHVQWQLLILLFYNSASIFKKMYTQDIYFLTSSLYCRSVTCSGWATQTKRMQISWTLLKASIYKHSSITWSFAGVPEVCQTILSTVSSAAVELSVKCFMLGLRMKLCFHHIIPTHHQKQYNNALNKSCAQN